MLRGDWFGGVGFCSGAFLFLVLSEFLGGWALNPRVVHSLTLGWYTEALQAV